MSKSTSYTVTISRYNAAEGSFTVVGTTEHAALPEAMEEFGAYQAAIEQTTEAELQDGVKFGECRVEVKAPTGARIAGFSLPRSKRRELVGFDPSRKARKARVEAAKAAGQPVPVAKVTKGKVVRKQSAAIAKAIEHIDNALAGLRSVGTSMRAAKNVLSK